MLHTVNKSPFESSSLKTCLSLARGDADVLLIEDGVYGALSGSAHTSLVAEALGDVRVYALEPDLKARGLSRDRLIPGIEVVGYDGFVELACANDKIQNWL
ncbi:MAG TPA: sulfurtransferase complex subunit TusB [Gammaproteobacteria bacterium]|nr:sulfurtransferase complex subunit TusB [Gammaproteobacteria bacterium]|tara:strand:+ start:849 stop:1151 length:303 start_codon:yes stop_codon:yes gene_type:complete